MSPSTAAPTTATPPTPESRTGRLSSAIDGILRAHHRDPILGATVAVAVPEEAAVTVTMGTRTDEPGSSDVDPTIPWPVGSVTKTFVAVVVLQLADEGALRLDDPIGPLLEASGVDLADADSITVRQLLQHTSGLAEYISDPLVRSDVGRSWTAPELVAIAEAAGRVDVPGGGHHYSNTNYILLGEIIRHVTGHAWEDEVEQRIVEPLGLSSTGLIGPDLVPGYTVVDGHLVRSAADADPSVGGAAGAMQSTVADLIVYLGALREGPLLSDESRSAMQQMIPVGDLTEAGIEHFYGLGLERYATGEIEVIGHLGVTDEAGYSAFIGWDTSTGTLVAVQLNTGVGGPQAFIALESLLAARVA